MTKIKELSENNDKKFYSLVNHQRQQNSLITSKLKYNDKVAECDEAIVETWAEYFEDLATPVNQPSFDEKYKTQVEEDNKTLHAYYNSNKEPLTEVNENEVLKYIFSFKNGKAPDDSKVTSEHLKYGGQKLITVLTMLVNFIFQNKHIPPILKSGIACPIYKKRWETN